MNQKLIGLLNNPLVTVDHSTLESDRAIESCFVMIVIDCVFSLQSSRVNRVC